jgi:hypothetical protein
MARLRPHLGRSGDDWIELTVTWEEGMGHKTVTAHVKKAAGVGVYRNPKSVVFESPKGETEPYDISLTH